MQIKEHYVPRRELIKKVLGLKDIKVFFIFGIPGSGKTSFLKSFHKRVKAQSIFLDIEDEDNDLNIFIEKFLRIDKKAYERDKFYVIIDDFQKIYRNRRIISYLTKLFKIENFIFLISSREEFDIEEKFHILKYRKITEKQLWFTREEVKRFYWIKYKRRLKEEHLDLIYKLSKGWPVVVSVLIDVYYRKGIKSVITYHSKNSIGEYLEKEIIPLIPEKLRKNIGILGILPSSFNLSDVKGFLNKNDYRTLLNILKFLNSRIPFINYEGLGRWEVHSLFVSFLRERGYIKEDILKRIKRDVYEEKFPISALDNYFYSRDFTSFRKLIKKRFNKIDSQCNLDILEKIIENTPSQLLGSEEIEFLKAIYYKKTGNYNVSFKIFDKLRRKKGDFSIISAYFASRIMMLTGNLKLARRILYSSLRNIKDKNKLEKVLIFSTLGSSYIFSDDLNRAEKYLRKAIEVCEEIKDDKLRIPIEINLKIVEKGKGELKEEDIYVLLRKIEKRGETYNYLVLLYHFLEFLYKNCKIQKVYEYVSKGKKLSFMIDEYLYNAFEFYENKTKIIDGRYDEAEKGFLKIVKKFRGEESSQYLSSFFHLIRIYILKEKYEEAKEMFKEIEKDFETLEMKALKLLLETFKVFLNVMTGYKNEIYELEDIVEEIRKSGWYYDYAWMLLYLIKALRETGDFKKAQFYMKRFNRLIKKYNFNVLIKEKEKLLHEEKENIHVQLLGEFKILKNGNEISLRTIKGEKARKLLKFLFMKYNNVVSNEEIIEIFWRGGKLKKALNSLYVSISEIRNFLKESTLPFKIIKKGEGYMLKGEKTLIDTEKFLMFYKKAFNSSKYNEKMENIEKALSLYKGEFLECEKYSDFCVLDREFYKRKYCDILLLKGKLLYEKNKWESAETVFKNLIDIDPVNTEAHRFLIKCLEKMKKGEEIIKVKKRFTRNYYLRFKEKPPSDFL